MVEVIVYQHVENRKYNLTIERYIFKERERHGKILPQYQNCRLNVEDKESIAYFKIVLIDWMCTISVLYFNVLFSLTVPVMLCSMFVCMTNLVSVFQLS